MNPRWTFALALLLLPACRQGSGSDIGPILDRAPRDDWRVLVRDDQGRAVSGATVSVEGVTSTAITGRPGRGQIPTRFSGRRAIAVDASTASATDTDLLGNVTLAAETGGTDELPFVIFVPDLAGSSTLAIDTGVQGAPHTLDDSASSGVRLAIDFGATVDAVTRPRVTIRSGKLSTGHQPPLPELATGVRVCAGAVVISPPTLTISPAATLSVPNDLAVASGASADVLFLDPITGSWTVLGVATPSDGGTRLTASGVVTRGGLYAFATSAAITTTVSGRYLDLEGKPVSDVLVGLGEQRTRTGSDGAFTLAPVATQWADGSARTLALEAFGGRAVRSQRRVDAVPLVPGVRSVGDLTIDAPRVGTVRLLQVSNGNRDPGRRMRVSSVFGLSYGLGIGDDQGETTFEEQEHGQTATNTGWILDDHNYFLTELTNDLLDRDLVLDMRLFTREQPYWQGRPRGTATYTLDRYGSGLIGGVKVARGQTPREGFVDETRLGRPVSTDYGLFGEITGSIQTTSAGRTVVSASSFVDPDSGRAELPIERAARGPIGAFDRHGRVVGSIRGATGPATRIRATRRLCLEDWYDAAWFDRAVLGDVPRKRDPEVAGGNAFDLGVPVPIGNLVAVTGTTNAGVLTAERMGWVGKLAPVEGAVVARDVELTLACDTAYSLPLALRNASPLFAASEFTFDLGVELSDGTLLDIARGLGGTSTTSSESLGLNLPSLALAGARRWLVALEATKTVSGKTITQKSFVPLAGTTGPSVTQLAVPDITAPAPGAAVSATGFTVSYTVPAGASYVEVEVRSETAGETRTWHAVVHPRYSSYTFRELPTECPQPLVAGRTWTVTVTAARIETGPFTLQEEIYNRCTTSWVGLSEATREVNAISSTAIQVTTF